MLKMTRFSSLFSTTSWDETPIEVPSLSATSPSPPRLTRLRSERTFTFPAASTGGPAFSGASVAEYILAYGTLEEGQEQHAQQAGYTGFLALDGIFRLGGGEEVSGSLVLKTEGRFEGIAKAKWGLVEGSVAGALKEVLVKEEGRGGYESKGMEGSEAWLELAVKA